MIVPDREDPLESYDDYKEKKENQCKSMAEGLAFRIKGSSLNKMDKEWLMVSC